jgi:hypothetical protein
MAERGTGFIAASGISDLGGKIPDDDHSDMAEVLKFAHFADGHKMSDMHIESGGVYTILDSERFSSFGTICQFGFQFVQWDDLFHVFTDDL